MNNIQYYGEKQCSGIKKSGQQCTNKAYYIDLMCGVHSKNKIELPKNALIKEQQIKDHNNSVNETAMNNKENKIKGTIILSKLFMMKSPENINGFLKVFPNYKHGNRKDGLGLPSLSPKSLGPIYHGQPNIPHSLNLENLHQGNKRFEGETMDIKSLSSDGVISNRSFAFIRMLLSSSTTVPSPSCLGASIRQCAGQSL